MYDTRYRDVIVPRLVELGVRHIRDGNCPGRPDMDAKLKELAGRHGIRALVFNDPVGLSGTLTQMRDHALALNQDPSRPILMVEGPNEWDMRGWADWPKRLHDATVEIWRLYEPTSSSLPVAGPSFARSFGNPSALAAREAAIPRYMQWGNLHSYTGGMAPDGPAGGGYGRPLDETIAEYRKLSGSDPLIAGETGYTYGPGFNPVSYRAAAKYFPRMFLTYLQKGIRRAYVYQLIETEAKHDFGLLNRDGSPRPPFGAIKSFIALLKDAGPSFQPGTLDFELTGDLRNVQSFVLQKRDGTFFLALWQAVPSYDFASKRDLETTPRAVTLELTTPVRSARTYLPSTNGTAVQRSYDTPRRIEVSVVDHVLLIELAPTTAGPRPDAGLPRPADGGTPHRGGADAGPSPDVSLADSGSPEPAGDATDTGSDSSPSRRDHAIDSSPSADAGPGQLADGSSDAADGAPNPATSGCSLSATSAGAIPRGALWLALLLTVAYRRRARRQHPASSPT